MPGIAVESKAAVEACTMGVLWCHISVTVQLTRISVCANFRHTLRPGPDSEVDCLPSSLITINSADALKYFDEVLKFYHSLQQHMLTPFQMSKLQHHDCHVGQYCHIHEVFN